MTVSTRLPDLTAVVLAGGRSSRFGSDKLTFEVDGRPLLHQALVAVAAVADRIVVVTSPASTPDLPPQLAARIRVTHDPEPFGGPLAGLRAGLAVVETSVAVAVGGDMPRMVPAVLRRLATAVGPAHSAVYLEVPDRLHPLPLAIDVVLARRAAAVVLDRGDRAIRDLLAELHATAVPAPEWLALDPGAATIVDIDRPADLRS